MMVRGVFIGVIVAMMSGSAAGASPACPQARAVYLEPGSRAQISFSGPLSDADAMQHRFTLIVPQENTAGSEDVQMDGVVMAASAPKRPWGLVMHNCPQGDATGAEIAACTIWQGPVYAIDDKGTAGWLPEQAPEGETAAASLILPDFGSALLSSPIWHPRQLATLPGDVFSFETCQK